LVLVILAALLCLVIFLIIIGVVVRAVARSALIGMVRQVTTTETVTVTDGWRWGWSSRAWRLFLVGLVIGIPVAIVSMVLIVLALSPLLLLLTEETGLMVLGVVLTVAAGLGVILLLTVISAVITPLQELAWRRTVLAETGVLASLSETVSLIRRHLKDVVLIWLLLIGVAIGWGIVALVVVLPVGLIAGLVVGGIPAALVYAVSGSWVGAAVAGLPLGFLALLLITSFATGLYMVFNSSVWTLAYLEVADSDETLSPAAPESAAPPSTPLGPEPQASDV
jgi:hypothetical protein